MSDYDDELIRFESEGAPALPEASIEGYVENKGAKIWYAVYGVGMPVILLHGGLGHSGNWGGQVPVLIENGYQVILIDSRGHGRSTRNDQPYSYQLMASDVTAVMDSLCIERAGFIGWSDGADTALVLADMAPLRAAGVLFFGCNMDDNGTKQITDYGPTLTRCFSRHTKDYARLSSTPGQFASLVDDLGLMQRTQPNYSAQDLERINVPVWVVYSENDEFIKQEHAEYLAATLPKANLIILKDVSHFAPLQRPDEFNATMLAFLEAIYK